MQPKWNGMKALITYKESHERRAPYKLRCSRQVIPKLRVADVV
jgi:hypothetical protein